MKQKITLKHFKLLFFLVLFFTVKIHAQNNPNFYLAENGVTCMCPDAEIGETGTVNINGTNVTLTKRTKYQITLENAATTCTSGLLEVDHVFVDSDFNEDISHWDTSSFLNFNYLFKGATKFNQDISQWDVSGVETMFYVFEGATSFNQDISDWDVSSAKIMYSMFDGATSFNQDIGNWDVSAVFNMARMFNDAKSFNQDLSSWCVENIITEPDFFALNSVLAEENKPIWGTCSSLEPTISTSAASGLTSTTSKLNGNVTFDGTITDRGFVYSSSNNTPTHGGSGVSDVTVGSGTGNFSQTISDLSPSTTYYYQAYGITSEETTYGGVESFTTSATPTATGSITITNDPSDPTSDWLLSEGKLIPLVDGAKVNVNEVIDALASGDLIIEAETDVIIDANITPSLLGNRTLTLKANRDINLEDNSSIAAKDFSLNTILWSDADAFAGGVAYLKNQTEIFTHGGHLWIGGGSGSADWNGLIVGNSTSVGNTNNSNGISLIKTNINTDGGNIAFYGRGLSGSIAGTPTPTSTGNSTNTNGIRMHDGNFINAGSGTIYMYGFADNSYGSSNVNGVELSHTPGAPDLITSSNNTENAIFIEGYAQGPSTVANSWGFYTHLSTIENTGGGTIHIKGSAVRNSGVTVAQNGAVLANSGKIILEGTGAGGTNPNVLVQGAIGQKANSNVEVSKASIEIIGDRFSISGNVPNGRIQSSGILSLRPYTSGIDIGLGSASGTLEIPASYFQDNFVNGFSEIIIGDEQTGNITVGGTIVYKDLLTIKTNKNIVLTSDADMSSATANALTLWSRAGGNNEANDNNFGAIWMPQGSSINTGGGNLTMGGGSNPSIGYAMGDHSSGSAENNAIYRGVAMNGTVNAAGGNIIINGKGSSNISNTRGVNIAGSVSTSGAGTIIIKGIGRGASDAIALGDSSFNPAAIGILKTDTGTINLDGKPSGSTRNGLNISTSGSYIRTNGNFSVTTTGSITATTGALNVGGNTHLEAADNITMTHTTNDFVGPMVVNVASNLQLTDQNELTLGEISVSGTIEIATLEGDLTISGDISTTNATADAIQIFAGKNKIAGNPLGGNIKINGTPEITTGIGGQTKLYSGAILQSADLISLTGENNTRYNVDANTSTFDPVLGSGNYALIREKKNDPPTATNVSISGVLIVEEELTGTYDYNDSENEAESGTTYQWYRADDSNGTNQSTIVGADGITYVLSQEDVGKFISFEVTPNDGIDPGASVESNLMGAVADILSATISSSTNVSCNGGSDGSVTVSVTGGIEPYKYSWNDPSGSTIATVENLSAGTYKVTIRDNQNQETTASVTITQPEVYEVDDPLDVVACDSYTLPDLISGSYFSENNGDGVEISAGSEITESQTLYVYGENTNGCTDQNEFKITINKNDISGVSFTDKEVVYNGNLHTLAVSGLPEGASVDYNVSNSYTHSGSYTIKATISSAFESCPDRELEATLTIKKAEATITAETTEIFTYDGTVKNVAAILNHSETELSYTPQQGYTDAGIYPVTISAEETDNYLSVSKEVSLVIENAEIEGVTFESETFTYDSTSKSIFIHGLPEGATVKYENNGQTNADTYKVTATISQENFNDKVLIADLVINKAKAIITADAVQNFTYDGTVKNVVATLNHSETELTYTPQQGYTNAGIYPVTVTVEETDNYLSTSKEVSLVIENAEITGVAFENETFTYNGEVHNISVIGLPEGASVSYENNDQTAAGTYEVTATISQENFNDKVLTADLVINKAEAVITADAIQIFTYDGTVKDVAATLNHSETELTYTPQQGYTNAGIYPVTVTVEETDNYLSTSKEVSLVIENAEITGVAFENETFNYNGEVHNISVIGLPEGASVSYENNDQTAAGTYEVTATISQENYNDKVLTADLVINKAEAVVTADAIQTFTYDGTEKNVTASLNHSEAELSYTPQQGYTDAGTYPVTISAEATSNYEAASEQVSLNIKNAEIIGVTFESETFTYDGTSKDIFITGLPEGATVKYENSGQTNAGTYKVTATISQENFNDKVLTADLVIKKAEAVVTADAIQTFTYDGTEKNVTASLNHSEAELSYTPQQGYTDAGTYPVTISAEATSNYEAASEQVSLNIKNAEITGVTFEGETYTYDGASKTIAVTGLPEGASVSYENNDQTAAGTYEVTATISQENFNDKVLTADLVIKKAEAVVTADAIQTFTYDGTEKNVTASLNHSEAELSYTPQQGYTDAGTYPVTVSVKETDNYLATSKKVSLVIDNAEITGVTFEGETYTYDGASKTLSVTGLPEGASVSYENNDQTAAGTYEVTAAISQENYNDKVLTADLVINKAEAVVTADAIQTFTYDGTVKDVAAMLNHSETELSYTPQQGYADAGTYPVTVSVEETDNYLATSKEVSLVIENAEITGVTLEGETFTYDGTSKSIEVTGLPEGASVSYENNDQTAAGTYEVTATISQENYNDKVLTAELVINKAEAVITADAIQTFTYDGTVKDVAAMLNHSETELSYTPQQGYADAGTYPVTVSVEETDNYLATSKEVSLVVDNAEITGVAFENETFNYNGEVHNISVIGLPEGASVSYENNDQTAAGTYEVTATISQENYNDKVLTADLVINKAEAVITADAIQTFTYDGTVKDIAATLNHSETELAYAPQQGYIAAGTYPVTISAEETDNYLSISKEVLLVIENAEIAGVSFDGEFEFFTYDGSEHSIFVTGLPEGATVKYANNGQINAGSYKVTATVSQENFNDKVLTADLVIKKAEAVVTADAIQTFTYDGTEKNVTASLNHSEAELSYTPQQGYTDAGTYPVTISAEETDNYLSASKEVSLVIENAEITGVAFAGDTFTYDGTPHSIFVTGLPEGATVTYADNGQINAGTYTVTATVSQENFNDKVLTADLVINKAEAIITADAIQTFTYDGTVKDVAATLNHSETELAYAPQQGYIAAGTYPVTISAEETDNYLSISKELLLVIENAEIAGVSFDGEFEFFTYDGSEHSIFVTGLPEGASVAYNNNTHTNAGTYTVTATVSLEGYEDLVLTTTLVIKKAEQEISFNELEDLDQLVDEYLQLDATSSSGLPVLYSYTSETENPAATVGPRGFVRILGGGQITITATQPGNQNYEAAASVVRTLTIQGGEARLVNAVINGVTYSNPDEDIYYLIGCGNSEDEVQIQLEQNLGSTIDRDNSFTMSTPAPGIYKETVIVTSEDGNSTQTYHITVEKNFNFEDIVVQKFNNVLLVNNNPETNGGYKFTSYKWFKNGVLIGSGQSFSAGNNAGDQLDSESTYHVEMITEDGEVLSTCATVIQLKSSYRVVLARNPIKSGEQLELLADFPKEELETMQISIHNLNGTILKQLRSNSKTTAIELPFNSPSGVYILNCITKSHSKSLKFIVH